MQKLEAAGLGRLVTCKTNKHNREFFCKPAPESLAEDHQALQLIRVTHEEYRKLFYTAETTFCFNIQEHYQYELLATKFT